MAGEASAKVPQPARKDQPGPRTAKPGRPPLQPILALQQTAGNQAVARLVEERLKAKASPEPKLPKIAPAAIQDGLIPEVSPAVAREAVPEREGLPAPSMPKPAAQAPSDVPAAVMPEHEGPPPSPLLKAAVQARLEVPAVAALAAVVPPPVPAPPPPAPKLDVQATPAPAPPVQAAPSAPAPAAEAAPGAQAGPAPEAAPAAVSAEGGAEGGAEAAPGAPAAGAPEAAVEAPPAAEEAAKGEDEGEGKKEAKGEGKGEGKEEAKAAVGPEQDPAFQAVKARAAGAAKQQKSHGPAGGAAGAAQSAAVGPANEVASQAAGAQVGQMDAQQPQPFDRAAFKAALLEKIAAITPKTLEEADDFKDDGKAGEVKDAVTSKVAEGKEQAQGPIQQATEATPDPSGFQPKPVTPLAPNDPGPPPPDLQAAGAAPKPKGEAEVEAPMAEASQSIDQKMADAEVSDEQLEQSNEPDFQSAVDSKREAQTNAAEAPGIYRADEQSTLSTAQAQAVSTAAVETEAMHGSRAALLNEVTGEQDTTKTADEQKRAEVSQHIETLYQETKQKVEDRLTRLDEEVNGLFDRGAEAARVAFEDYVDRRMNDYKDDRYDVIGGSLLWAKDKLFGMPDEVNAFYVEGRELYVQKMDAVIDEIATAVETGLTEAKGLIALGRQQVQEYVDSLPLDLQQVGQDAAQAIQDKFDSLEQSVQDKQGQLIDSLAKKYVDNLQKIDARIEELKAANRGLVDKVLDAIGEIIRTILKLKDMLLGVLARAASVIGKIIKNPIGFLGNLVEAVGLGLSNFMSNLGTHLKEGLLAWLFGALAEAGIQVPESFDLKGILSLILQVLGLTYANIRARAVAIVGEPVVRGLEQAAEVFKILLTEGPAGLWSFIQDKLSELKETVMEGIKSFIMEKVIIAGITWLIGLLNPAAAFIKACKAIYDIVMFFVTRGSQIITLINAILDSMAAIASGAIAGAAAAVENALAKAIPVVIGFLASLLGLGGISEKIRSILQQIRNPINKAIDFVIHQAVKLVKAAGSLLGIGKKKEEPAKDTGDPEHDAKVEAGLAAIDQEEQPFLHDGKISHENAEKVAVKVRTLHPIFKSLVVVDAVTRWKYHYVASPGDDKDGAEKEEGGSPKPTLVARRVQYRHRFTGELEAKVRNAITQLSKIKVRPPGGGPEVLLKGIQTLIDHLQTEKEPAALNGFVFQAERTLTYWSEGKLEEAERLLSTTTGGKVYGQPDIVSFEGGEEILVETKNWTGFETWPEEDRATNLGKLYAQLANYLQAGHVRLEWKGAVPAAVLQHLAPLARAGGNRFEVVYV